MALLGMVARGAGAGVLGTLLMTPVQLLGLEPSSRRDRARWMPRQVFTGVARRLGFAQKTAGDQRTALASGAHLAYGAAFGALYALWRRKRGGSLPSGLAFGLAVWAANYAGILPAAHIVPPPDEEDPAQTARLVAAHVVYGTVLGLAAGRGEAGDFMTTGPAA
jgi:hypothetical protein